jgi:hypothetical protein
VYRRSFTDRCLTLAIYVNICMEEGEWDRGLSHLVCFSKEYLKVIHERMLLYNINVSVRIEYNAIKIKRVLIFLNIVTSSLKSV